jgi:hypothetical protein
MPYGCHIPNGDPRVRRSGIKYLRCGSLLKTIGGVVPNRLCAARPSAQSDAAEAAGREAFEAFVAAGGTATVCGETATAWCAASERFRDAFRDAATAARLA